MKKVTESHEMEDSSFIASPGGALFSLHCHMLDQRAEDSKKDTSHRSKALEEDSGYPLIASSSMKCTTLATE